MKLAPAFLACALVVLAPVAFAQDPNVHQHEAAPAAGEKSDAANEAFEAANEKMHEGMDIELTGDADVDFVRGMIPHHQGAVDMANVVLKYGKDPEIRKLAEGVIKAQEDEIVFMKTWLAKHGK
ncbi:MAG: DUF305 domain-containing protein [Hyphomicrobium sp.]|nr:DUF305 domain-containing protein [Hyphomicrobium sp.]